MKLNKYIAHAGICSRRKAIMLVKDGHVAVNDHIIFEPGYDVKNDDHVKLDGTCLLPTEEKVYLLFNKPIHCITTVSDEKGRKTVLDFIPTCLKRVRLYPVGRLDWNTTGLLIMTNDGDFAQRLQHPRHGVYKIYDVTLEEPLSFKDLQAIRQGIKLSDGKVIVDDIAYITKAAKHKVRVILHSGKYRVIRRLFAYVGYNICKLDRVGYAGLTTKNLARGSCRFLTKREILMLKNR